MAWTSVGNARNRADKPQRCTICRAVVPMRQTIAHDRENHPPAPFEIRDDCGLCGEDATLDDYAEFTGPDGQRMMAHSSCAAEHNFTQS